MILPQKMIWHWLIRPSSGIARWFRGCLGRKANIWPSPDEEFGYKICIIFDHDVARDFVTSPAESTWSRSRGFQSDVGSNFGHSDLSVQKTELNKNSVSLKRIAQAMVASPGYLLVCPVISSISSDRIETGTPIHAEQKAPQTEKFPLPISEIQPPIGELFIDSMFCWKDCAMKIEKTT
jgi:hypothetical protein